MVQRELSRLSHHSDSSRSSSCSDLSVNTYGTAPLKYVERSLWKSHGRRFMMQYDHRAHAKEPLYYDDFGGSRSSHAPIPSEEDLAHHSEFEAPLSRRAVYASDGVPSKPADFAGLFSSNRRLLIHHDDATSDGNMNLRVDTELFDPDGRSQKLILFHLRMHDLKDRRFSLRRYCRESGKQICASSRKYAPAPRTTSATSDDPQWLSHAFKELPLNHERSISNYKNSSGQGSDQSPIEDGCHSLLPAEFHFSQTPSTPIHKVQLAFSNYAHVVVNRRGSKRSRRYEYEYQGTKYEWRRQLYQNDYIQEVSYHLVSDGTSRSIAHITPTPLNAREAQEEEDLGGWVPPCTMQITDRRVFRSLTDVAE